MFMTILLPTLAVSLLYVLFIYRLNQETDLSFYDCITQLFFGFISVLLVYVLIPFHSFLMPVYALGPDTVEFHGFIKYFFRVGFFEEAAKFLTLMVGLTILDKKLVTPMNILILSGINAIGFATIENLEYFKEDFSCFLTRSVFCNSGHMVLSFTATYFFFFFKDFKISPVKSALLGIFIAGIYHGIIDYNINYNLLPDRILTIIEVLFFYWATKYYFWAQKERVVI